MTNPMIEKVARAICRAQFESVHNYLGAGFKCTVDEWVEKHWERDIPSSRSAISALREPSEGMLGALLDVKDISKAEYGHLIEKWTPRFSAMIDAALAEDTKK